MPIAKLPNRQAFALVLLSGSLLSCLGPSQKDYTGSRNPAVDCSKPVTQPAPPATTSGQQSGGSNYSPPGSSSFYLLASPNYATEISVVMQKCTACHGTAGGVALTSFEAVKANAPRSLDLMKSGKMPPAGRMPDQDIANFQTWIGLGYPRDSSTVTTPPTVTSPVPSNVPAAPTYLTDIKPVIDLSCGACHGAVAKFPFATLEQVQLKAAGILTRTALATTDLKFMPKGKQPLGADFLAKFRQWQAAGFPSGLPVQGINPPVPPSYPPSTGNTPNTQKPPGC